MHYILPANPTSGSFQLNSLRARAKRRGYWITHDRHAGTWSLVDADLRRPLVGLQKIWERVRTAAGIGDLRLHDLRHGFASVGVNRGVSLALLQGLLGHASPLTTSRYAHLQTDALRGEADGIAASISAALTPIRVPATPKTE